MPSRFETLATPIEGLTLLQRLPLGDSRGFLERMFCREELQPLLGSRVIEQINRTLTARRGTVRGMHFQYPPHAETKIVSCLRGEIFDVAVDLRRSSRTFLEWHGEVLSAENHRTLFIPEGFAHGFQTLTDDCELLYLHTAAYRADSESAVNALDPRLNIRWPLAVEERSARDEAHALIAADFLGVS